MFDARCYVLEMGAYVECLPEFLDLGSQTCEFFPVCFYLRSKQGGEFPKIFLSFFDFRRSRLYDNAIQGAIRLNGTSGVRTKDRRRLV